MCMPRRGRKYPHRPRSKLLLGRLLISSARSHPTVFSTGLFLTVLQEIMTEMGFWSQTSSEACGRSHNSVKRVLNSVKRVLNIIKLVLNSVKLVLNSVKLSKTSTKLSQNPVKRPSKPRERCNTAPGTSGERYYACVLLPPGSPTVRQNGLFQDCVR